MIIEALKLIGVLLLALIALIVAGLLLNGLGHLSRTSRFWKTFSIFLLILIGGFIILVVAVDTKPFILSVFTDKNGNIGEINIVDSPISLSITPKSVKGNTIFFSDSKGRTFRCRLDEAQSGRRYSVPLIPIGSLFGWLYAVIKTGDSGYVIFTAGRIIAAFMSFMAVLLVWLAGLEGKLAMLTIDAE